MEAKTKLATIEEELKAFYGDKYEDYKKLMSEKSPKEPTEFAKIVEVNDKYGYLSGYRININSIRKGKYTEIVKIEGRIDKVAALKIANENMNRLVRKFKIKL